MSYFPSWDCDIFVLLMAGNILALFIKRCFLRIFGTWKGKLRDIGMHGEGLLEKLYFIHTSSSSSCFVVQVIGDGVFAGGYLCLCFWFGGFGLDRCCN